MNCLPLRIITSIAILFQTAYAVEPKFFSSAESSVGQVSPIISFGYIMQLLFSLLVVFGFIYVTAKYLLPKIKTSTKGYYLSVIDKVVLEPQVSSYIIKAGKSSWLVIVSNKHIAKIDKLDEGFEQIK